jgi:hypothetical protein
MGASGNVAVVKVSMAADLAGVPHQKFLFCAYSKATG